MIVRDTVIDHHDGCCETMRFALLNCQLRLSDLGLFFDMTPLGPPPITSCPWCREVITYKHQGYMRPTP